MTAKRWSISIQKWSRKSLRSNDIQAALHQIFTNVRLKTLIEIRDVDCLPFKYIIAPVAFLTGLIDNRSLRGELVNEFLSWTKQERKTWNKLALKLDIDKPDSLSCFIPFKTELPVVISSSTITTLIPSDI